MTLANQRYQILVLAFARRAAARDYWEWKRICRTRPWTACQRIFPARNGEMLDAWEAQELAREEFALGVPPEIATVEQAQAWLTAMPEKDFQLPSHRT